MLRVTQQAVLSNGGGLYFAAHGQRHPHPTAYPDRGATASTRQLWRYAAAKLVQAGIAEPAFGEVECYICSIFCHTPLLMLFGFF